MSIPILRQGSYLIASIQSSPSDSEWREMGQQLAERVGKLRSRGVVVDVTVLDLIDSFAARTLREIAQTVKLRGAEPVIVGIQPDVAFSMVQLGLTLGDIETELDLEEGMAMLDAILRDGRTNV
ncbi:MAG: STAS domain-containing protein [Syntrophales bacterium]|nr:STAS domain-containing protein [Syntrophales bacterium]MCK9391503.1 STAS domain-containing protein [Syntrophales bacterium]